MTSSAFDVFRDHVTLAFPCRPCGVGVGVPCDPARDHKSRRVRAMNVINAAQAARGVIRTEGVTVDQAFNLLTLPRQTARHPEARAVVIEYLTAVHANEHAQGGRPKDWTYQPAPITPS